MIKLIKDITDTTLDFLTKAMFPFYYDEKGSYPMKKE